jgi:hypothetical protein
MFTVDLEEGYLARHERMALELGAGEFLLPATIAYEGGRTKLMYQTEGFVTVKEYGFHGDLYRLFRALKGYVRDIYAAQDMLLSPGRLFRTGDRVFVSTEDCAVRVAYGAQEPERSAYGHYTEALMPLLAELSAKAGVTGAKSAMMQLAKKIKAANPGYETAIKLIESTERRWNYMQPVGI